MAEKATEAIFDELFKKSSKQYAEFYDLLVGRYLRMPFFGIGRESMQEAAAAVDAYSQMAGKAAEFLHHFSGPFIASLKTLDETVEENADKIDSAKDFYNLFMDGLDTKYEAYLRSPEAVGRVAELIEGYLEFKKHLDNALEPWLVFHSIPTKRDMEDVYRSIHGLKRKNRELESVIKKQQAAFESLAQKVKTLEAAVPGRSRAKKTTAAGTAKSGKLKRPAGQPARRRKNQKASADKP